MNEEYKFPIECSYKQTVYDSVVLLNSQNALAASIQAADSRKYTSYEAFDRSFLVPSLYQLVKKVNTEKQKQNAILKWVGEHGFLGCNLPHHQRATDWFKVPSWERIADFWKEAEALSSLWDRYIQITQRDKDRMKEWIRFIPRPLVEDPLDTIFWPKESLTKVEYYPFYTADIDSVFTLYYDKNTQQIEKEKPPYHYQWAAASYIGLRIQHRLEGMAVSSKNWRLNNKARDSQIKTTPVLKCYSLLQALYMQFYIVLTETASKKVCPVCGDMFEPNRTNQVYCPYGGCKLTAKSRRYRSRTKGTITT